MSFYIDPLLSAKRNTLALIGHANKLALEESDYEFGTLEEVIDAAPFNTALQVIASQSNTHVGSVVVRYRRLTLTESAKHVDNPIITPSDTEETIHAAFAAQFGIVASEIALLTPLPSSKEVDVGAIVNLTFEVDSNRSLLYLPSTFTVAYTWTEPPLESLITNSLLPGFEVVVESGMPYTLPFTL